MRRLDFEPLEGRQLLSSLNSPNVKPFNNPVYAITATIPSLVGPGGTGNVFQSKITVAGEGPGNGTVWLAEGRLGHFTNVARVDTNRNYSLTVNVPKGRTELRLFAEDAALRYSTVTKLDVTRGNPIIAWDSLALEAIQQEHLTGPEAARSLAILHLAQYDAVASVQFPKNAYLVNVAAPRGASADVAAGAAAETVLAALFPSEAPAFTQAMDQELAESPKSPAVTRGFALGQQVGQATLAARANDGSANPGSLAPSNIPGHWRPTPPKLFPAVDAAWGGVTPFALTSGSQFRPPAPPSVGSTAYDQALAEVTSLGRSDSPTRTADQTAAVHFWSNEPYAPTDPSHWSEIAEGQALKRKGSLAQDARLFAMLDVAMADTGIAASDAKSAYSTWRPVSAVQETDPSWTPLETTPSSASYVSGHAAFGAAAANILSSEFGPKVAFTDTLDSTSGVSRSFTSFAAAALEDGQSRVWAGQNVSYDVQQGQAIGDKVGGFVVTRFPRLR